MYRYNQQFDLFVNVVVTVVGYEQEYASTEVSRGPPQDPIFASCVRCCRRKEVYNRD